MGFLDKSNLKRGRMVVERHPILANGDVPLNVRQMYLQGCIMAVLERKDGNLSASDKTKLKKLGTALQIAIQDIDEAISTMSSLKSAEDQEAFLHEFFLLLSGEEYPTYFMKDFESLLKGNGELSDEASQTLDYFGQGLTGSQNWREACKCRQVNDAQEELPDIQKVTNWEGAAKAYFAAAEAGNAYAQGCLAYCYAKTRTENGGGNDEKMFELAKKSATKGVPIGQKVLGFCFSEGIGTERDFAEGAKWYRKAAEQGDAGAQAYLGLCYAQGQGLTEDITEAIKWWRKAAEQGDAMAQSNLGVCYDTGNGVTENKQEAVMWYRKAALQGDAFSQRLLGICYMVGEGVAENKREAVKWFRKAAEQGDVISQNNLGYCYANGEGVAKDDVEAVKWYRKAAKQGNADAQCNLGNCYLNGQGVQKNSGEAIRWYRMAAEQGSSKARFNLGCCYVEGVGVQVNEGEGIRWLQQVVESGGELADEAQEIISKLQSETAFQKWDRNISNKIDDFFDNLFG